MHTLKRKLAAAVTLLALMAPALPAVAHTGFCTTHLAWNYNGSYRHSTGNLDSHGKKLTIIQKLTSGGGGGWVNYDTIYKTCI